MTFTDWVLLYKRRKASFNQHDSRGHLNHTDGAPSNVGDNGSNEELWTERNAEIASFWSRKWVASLIKVTRPTWKARRARTQE